MQKPNGRTFTHLNRNSGILIASVPMLFVRDYIRRCKAARFGVSLADIVTAEGLDTVARYATVSGTRLQWNNFLQEVEEYAGEFPPYGMSHDNGPAVRAAAKRILDRVRAIVALFDAEGPAAPVAGPAAPVAGPAAPVDAPAAPAEEAEGEWLVEIEEGDELPATCPQTAPAVRPTVYVNNTAPRPWELKALQETASVLETCEWFLCDALRKALQCAETGQWQSVIFLRAANSLGGIRSTRCLELRRALCDSMGILQSQAETMARAVELRGAGVSTEWAASEKEFILRELNVCIAKIVGEKAANRAALRAVKGGR